MARPPRDYLADFHSATAMLRALAAFLHGKDFPNLGLTSALKPAAIGTNLLPPTLRQEVYKLGGYFAAIAPERLERIKDEDIARFVVEQYPARRYPALLVGSSNGALVHLAAAPGAPWLPQTFLIPLHQRGIEIDEPKQALEFGRAPGRRLLEANPDLQVHHMHDANQDRLMTQYMTYFRIKRRRLGEAYARFLEERLQPGGIVILVECRHSWPTTRVGPRHVFQQGGAGGITPQEYIEGGPRVARWFAELGLDRARWDSPAPDGESPEAEWGFEEALHADSCNSRPRSATGWCASLSTSPRTRARWWPICIAGGTARGLPANRLLVDSFILMDPWSTLRLAAVPFWMKFNTEVPARALERYLDETEPYDEIHLVLSAHGVHSIGLTPIERWRALLARAREHGCSSASTSRPTRPISPYRPLSPGVTSDRWSLAGAAAFERGAGRGLPPPERRRAPHRRHHTRCLGCVIPRFGRAPAARRNLGAGCAVTPACSSGVSSLKEDTIMPRLPFVMMSGALGLTLLAGCADLEDRIQNAGGDGDDGPRTVAFDCDDDRDFRVRLSGDRDEARVDTGDETYELERTGRDDGRRVYSNDDGVRLEISNEEADLRIPGESNFEDCERS